LVGIVGGGNSGSRYVVGVGSGDILPSGFSVSSLVSDFPGVVALVSVGVGVGVIADGLSGFTVDELTG
jgi:hypothetical protein